VRFVLERVVAVSAEGLHGGARLLLDHVRGLVRHQCQIGGAFAWSKKDVWAVGEGSGLDGLGGGVGALVGVDPDVTEVAVHALLETALDAGVQGFAGSGGLDGVAGAFWHCGDGFGWTGAEPQWWCGARAQAGLTAAGRCWRDRRGWGAGRCRCCGRSGWGAHVGRSVFWLALLRNGQIAPSLRYSRRTAASRCESRICPPLSRQSSAACSAALRI
jgi:hypothetical protein